MSPHARPDYVCGEVLDHTSVLKLGALDLTGPLAFLEPPSLP